MAEPTPRSPLVRHRALLARGSAAEVLELAEPGPMAQVSLRATPGAAAERVREELGAGFAGGLPDRVGTTAGSDDLLVACLGPDEWLVLAALEGGPALTARLADAVGDGGAAVDLSAARAALVARGRSVRDVLALGCSLDLHPSVLGPGRCAQTVLASTPMIVVVRDADASGELVYWLLARASYAGHLASWLATPRRSTSARA